MKVRNTNVELLRILAMFLIVAHHFSFYGVMPHYSGKYFTLGVLFSQLLIAGGKFGVDLFVIISGYFLCTSKFRSIRIFSLMRVTRTYSLIFLLFAIFAGERITVMTAVRATFPTLYVQYWFIATYVIMVLISPLLNALIVRLKPKQLFRLGVFFLVFVFILPNFLSVDIFESNLFRFSALYIFGAIVRNFKGRVSIRIVRGVFWTNLLVMGGSILSLDGIGVWLNRSRLMTGATHFTSDYSAFCALAAASLLWIVVQQKQFQNRWINKISSCMLGVYLIHENQFVRPLIWTNVLDFKALLMTPSLWIALGAIGYFTIVFVTATFIEFVRQFVVTRTLGQISAWRHSLNPIYTEIDSVMNALIIPSEAYQNNSSTDSKS